MNKLYASILIISLLISACENHQVKESISELPTVVNIDTPLIEKKDTISPMQKGIKANEKPLQAINTLEFNTYVDKQNGISLNYPKTWEKELNKMVPFKITAPLETPTDSLKENFYYVVFEEKSNQPEILKSNKNVALTLEQMNEKMCADLLKPKPNRKDVSILSSTKKLLNGIPAYEIISTGIINGYAMKYRICVLKKESKQYYLYYAGEQYTYERYKDYSDMLFSSFYIK